MSNLKKSWERIVLLILHLLMAAILIGLGFLVEKRNGNTGFGLVLMVAPGLGLIIPFALRFFKVDTLIYFYTAGGVTLVLMLMALTIKHLWGAFGTIWPALLFEPVLAGLICGLFTEAQLHHWSLWSHK